MKKSLTLTFSLVITFLFAFTFISHANVKVSQIDGDAYYIKSSSNSWKKLRTNMVLKDDYSIKVDEGSSVTLRINGTNKEVLGHSVSKISQLKRTGGSSTGLSSKLKSLTASMRHSSSAAGVRADEADDSVPYVMFENNNRKSHGKSHTGVRADEVSDSTPFLSYGSRDFKYLKKPGKYFSKGKYYKAIKILKKQIRKIKDPIAKSKANYLMGTAYYELAKFKDAIKYFSKIHDSKNYKLDPDILQSYVLCSFAYNQIGKYDDSEDTLVKLLKLTYELNNAKSYRPFALFSLGVSYIQSGNTDGARFIFEKIEKNHPDFKFIGLIKKELSKLK